MPFKLVSIFCFAILFLPFAIADMYLERQTCFCEKLRDRFTNYASHYTLTYPNKNGINIISIENECGTSLKGCPYRTFCQTDTTTKDELCYHERFDGQDHFLLNSMRVYVPFKKAIRLPHDCPRLCNYKYGRRMSKTPISFREGFEMKNPIKGGVYGRAGMRTAVDKPHAGVIIDVGEKGISKGRLQADRDGKLEGTVATPF